MDIDPVDHVMMQATFQKFVNNSISKTINLPNDFSVENVGELYKLAFEHNCKSLTIYRDRSRKNQILETSNADTVEHLNSGDTDISDTYISSRPSSVSGDTHRIETAHGSMYVTVNKWHSEHYNKENPYEVFVSIGKEGSCVNGYVSALTRIISIALRSGVPILEIVKQLEHISCHTSWDNGVRNDGPVDALATMLRKYVAIEQVWKNTGVTIGDDGDETLYIGDSRDREVITMDGVPAWKELELNKEKEVVFTADYSECPDCGDYSLMHQEGCVICELCGWSQC